MPCKLVVALAILFTLSACGEEAPITPPNGGGGAAETVTTPPEAGAVEQDPALATRAAKEYAAGGYAAVITLVTPGYEAGQASLRLRVLLGRSLQHLDRNAEALAVAQTIVADDADHIEGNALVGELLLEMRRPTEAIPALEVVLKRVQKPRWAVALGRAHLALGEAGKAKDDFEEALQLGSHDPAVHYDLGRIYLDRGYGSKAERALRSCAETGGTQVDLDRLRAQAFAAQAKWLAPLTAVLSPATESPGSVLGEQIIIHRITGSEDQAVISEGPCALLFALRYLGIQPADPTCLTIAADAWLSAGRSDEAARVIEALANLDPPPDLRQRRIELLLLRDDPVALAAYLESLQPDADFPSTDLAEAWYRCAVLLRAIDDPTRARTALEQADACDPAHEKVLRSLVPLLLELGDRPAATRTCQRLVELVPDATDIEELRRRLGALQADGKEVQ